MSTPIRGSGGWLRACVAVLSLSMLAACGSGSSDESSAPTIERIEISPAAPSAPLGMTQQLTATAVFADQTHVDVTSIADWTTVTPAVATVGNADVSKGRVQTVSLGTTRVSARFQGFEGATDFTVTDAVPRSLAITPSTLALPKGTAQTLTAMATFSDGDARDVSADASWTASSTVAATVGDAPGSKGRVSALNEGSTVVSAVYEGLVARSSITVTAAVVATIEVTPQGRAIPKGTGQQYAAVATFTDATTQDVTGVATWASSAGGVLAVSDAAGSKGLATGVSVGDAVVSASFAGKLGEAGATVTSAVLRALSVTPATASVAKGLTRAFTARGTYSDGATADVTTLVTWSSSNESVAKVSNATGSNGLAQALGLGTTTIQAATAGLSAPATLTVSAATLTALQVSPTTPSIPNGNSTVFGATGIYSDGSRQDLTQSATWTSSDPAIAEVSNATGSRGLTLAKAPGATTIAAAFGGQSASTRLTVTAATLRAIQVTPTNTRLAAGFSRPYAATGIYSDNSTADLTGSVTWSTAAGAIATVSNASGSRGVVSGVAAGSTDVIAQSGEVSGRTPVIVTSATLTAIGVTPAAPGIPLGTTQAFTATGTFSDSTVQDLTTQVSWTSSSTDVATISNSAGSQGLATSKSVGNTTIAAARGAISGSTPLTVTAATLTRITVTPNPAAVPKGTTRALTATGTYSDASTRDLTTSVTWSTADADIATVSNGGLLGTGSAGEVTGVELGTTTATAALDGVSGIATVNVGAAVLRSIDLTPANTSVAKGVAVQYKATGQYSDGSSADITKAVTWTSVDAGIASISNAGGSQGRASTNAVGSTTIQAAQGTITASTGLTVTAAVLKSIAVTPANTSIPAGTNQPFVATGTYSDGSTTSLTSEVIWSSSKTPVATISNAAENAGLASAVAAGATVITATSGSGASAISGATNLTVTEAALLGISVKPASGTVAAGYSLAYAATGQYADGSTKDITAQVSWFTFNEGVATVSNADGSKGRVSGVATGTTAVTATLGSVSGRGDVTVTAATLVSVAVTPDNATIGAGGTLQYTATGTFSDGSKLDLTRQVVWASSNSAAATIDQNGLASAGGTPLASTTISATHGTGAAARTGSTRLTRSV